MLFAKALDLGREISETVEFKQMRQVGECLHSDEVALKIIEDFQALQESCERMEMSGHPVTGEDIKKLEKLEQKAMGNPTLKSYFEANTRFNKLIEMVNDKIQEGIREKPHECVAEVEV